MQAMDAIESVLAPKVDRADAVKIAGNTKIRPRTRQQLLVSEATENKKSLAAGSVSRILSTGLLLQDGHSSGPRITARL